MTFKCHITLICYNRYDIYMSCDILVLSYFLNDIQSLNVCVMKNIIIQMSK